MSKLSNSLQRLRLCSCKTTTKSCSLILLNKLFSTTLPLSLRWTALTLKHYLKSRKNSSCSSLQESLNKTTKQSWSKSRPLTNGMPKIGRTLRKKFNKYKLSWKAVDSASSSLNCLRKTYSKTFNLQTLFYFVVLHICLVETLWPRRILSRKWTLID